jgi:hypothetical protein
MAARVRWALAPDSSAIIVMDDPVAVENDPIPNGLLFASEFIEDLYRLPRDGVRGSIRSNRDVGEIQQRRFGSIWIRESRGRIQNQGFQIIRPGGQHRCGDRRLGRNIRPGIRENTRSRQQAYKSDRGSRREKAFL